MSSPDRRRVCLALVVVGLCTAGCAGTAGSKDPAYVRGPAYTLAGSYIFPSSDPLAAQFNGVSGLAPLRDGHEMLAVLDDRQASRVFRIAVDWTAAGFRVRPLAAIPLQRGEGTPAALDPEGIAITRDGHMLISSEGQGNVEPRVPPGLIEYDVDGRFLRQLPLRPRYVPTPSGSATAGVRDNAGFESLTVSADFSRLFTATELPLIQDGDVDPFVRGVPTRLLEYVSEGGSYKPAREFAYEITPLERLTFTPRFSINGVVELLALDDGDLLVLERGYAESMDRAQSMNRIRLFRVSLGGATDISALDSLSGATFTPVRKTLVLDVNQVPGLSPRLEHLDNFEGMAWGPPARAGGPRPLILVSDDNQNPRQVTAFMLFERRMKP